MPGVKILRSKFGDRLNNTKVIISNIYNAKLLIGIIATGKCGLLNKISHNLSPETIVPQGFVFVNDKKIQFFAIFSHCVITVGLLKLTQCIVNGYYKQKGEKL